MRAPWIGNWFELAFWDHKPYFSQEKARFSHLTLCLVEVRFNERPEPARQTVTLFNTLYKLLPQRSIGEAASQISKFYQRACLLSRCSRHIVQSACSAYSAQERQAPLVLVILSQLDNRFKMNFRRKRTAFLPQVSNLENRDVPIRQLKKSKPDFWFFIF
jgi:hypothetical protein